MMMMTVMMMMMMMTVIMRMNMRYLWKNYLTDMFQSLTLILPLSCSFLTRFLLPTEERLPVGYVTYIWEYVI